MSKSEANALRQRVTELEQRLAAAESRIAMLEARPYVAPIVQPISVPAPYPLSNTCGYGETVWGPALRMVS